MTSERLIGVDVGASKIKGAVVEPHLGRLIGDAKRADTPDARTPASIASAVAEVVGKLSCKGTVGVALPCVVRDGVVRLAANLATEWVGMNAVKLLSAELGRPVVVMNDADAAGLAESRFGAATGRSGTVLVLTFGSGIGSALLHAGDLVPNTEFGHILLDGVVAEKVASAAVRKQKRLSWAEWSRRVSALLEYLSMIVQPDLVVIGGGVSDPRRVPHWRPRIQANVEVVPAALANRAGMIGAGLQALAAERG